MIGKQGEQIQMAILDIDSMIPEAHLLRRIKNCVNFNFILVIFTGSSQNGDLRRK